MTFRPLTPGLDEAIEAYQQANFLPSRNAAINQILSRALLGENQPSEPAAPTMPAPTSLPSAPTPPAPSLGGWS